MLDVYGRAIGFRSIAPAMPPSGAAYVCEFEGPAPRCEQDEDCVAKDGTCQDGVCVPD